MKHLAFHQSLFLPNEEVGLIFFLKISNDLLFCSGNSGWTVSWKLCRILLCWLRPAFLSQSHDYSFLGASLQPQFQKDGTLKFITPEKNLRKYTVFIQTKVILNLMATIYNLKKSWDKYNKKDVYRGNSKLSGDC